MNRYKGETNSFTEVKLEHLGYKLLLVFLQRPNCTGGTSL